MADAAQTAVTAVLAVARSHGLGVDEPVVLRAAWHVLVHLRPLPIVGRVSTSLPFPEGPHPDDLCASWELRRTLRVPVPGRSSR